MGKKKTIEEIKQAFEKEGYILLSTEYINAHSKLDYICPKGHKHSITWNKFNTGRRCPKCSGQIITFEEVKQAFKKEGYELLSTEYINNKTKLDYICLKGHKHSITWNDFQSGARCPECCGNIVTFKKVKQAFEKEGYTLLSNKYVDNKAELDYICPKGHKHSTCWNSFSNGRRCPECSIETVKSKLRLSYDEVKQGFEKEGYTLLSTEYIKSSSKLKVRCPKGHEYEVGWGHFASGVRCPKCNVSKGEERITLLLEQNNVNYETQKAFKECKNKKALRFDFYLPDYNVCIEYDGIQHHKPVDFGSKGQSYAEEQLKYNQKKDNIKTQYCLDNNIKLIRIPYWEFDNIENILEKELNLE